MSPDALYALSLLEQTGICGIPGSGSAPQPPALLSKDGTNWGGGAKRTFSKNNKDFLPDR